PNTGSSASMPDNSIHFEAALVGGLREGSYQIGRNFTEAPDSDLSFTSPPPWDLPNASPDVFFGGFAADEQKHGLDTGWQDPGSGSGNFVSRAGTLIIDRFDGQHVSGQFAMDVLQRMPDQVETGDGLIHLQRRTVAVTGQLSHVIPARPNISTGDDYTCGGPAARSRK